MPAAGVRRGVPAAGVRRGVPAAGVLRVVPAAGVRRVVPAAGVLRVVPAAGVRRGVPAAGILRGVPAAGVLRVVPAAGVLRVVSAAGVRRGVPAAGVPRGVPAGNIAFHALSFISPTSIRNPLNCPTDKFRQEYFSFNGNRGGGYFAVASFLLADLAKSTNLSKANTICYIVIIQDIQRINADMKAAVANRHTTMMLVSFANLILETATLQIPVKCLVGEY